MTTALVRKRAPLELASVDAGVRRALFTPTVCLRLLARETGKLTGAFTVEVDLEPAAARALADTLVEAADRLHASV